MVVDRRVVAAVGHVVQHDGSWDPRPANAARFNRWDRRRTIGRFRFGWRRSGCAGPVGSVAWVRRFGRLDLFRFSLMRKITTASTPARIRRALFSPGSDYVAPFVRNFLRFPRSFVFIEPDDHNRHHIHTEINLNLCLKK